LKHTFEREQKFRQRSAGGAKVPTGMRPTIVGFRQGNLKR